MFQTTRLFLNDRVNIHNDGSQANDTGALMLVSDVPNQGIDTVGTDATLINGLGMGTGTITFNEGTEDDPSWSTLRRHRNAHDRDNRSDAW